MTEIQIKLNELITPLDIIAKRRGSLYTLNNSLKRNTLYPPALNKHEEIGYDRKLPKMSLKRKDLAKILDVILSKEEMTLPDRNFLRRILVEIFDEQLICSGSRNFINHLKLLQHRAHDTIIPRERMFYFVLKGAATVQSGEFTYMVSERQTFGQIELLSNEDIQSITYTQNTLMVTLDQINFDNYFNYYFQKKYEEKLSHIACIEEKYLHGIPVINKYFLINHLKFQTFNSGDKIIEMGKPVTRIYFVGNTWKGEAPSNLMDGTFGLKQIMRSKETYLQSAYSLDLGYRVAYIQKEVFIKYVKNFLNLSNFMVRSTVQSKTNTRNPQADPSINNLMNLKRVKIHSKMKNKMHSEPIDTTIVSDFKFFKPLKELLITPKRSIPTSCNPSVDRLLFNSRKSQSIQLKSTIKALF